jgi:hypothetical protein
MELEKAKAEEITQGYLKYFQDFFPHFNKMGYLQIQIYKSRGKIGMSLCFGSGWGNTPWCDALEEFASSTNRRVKRKYTMIDEIHLCGYSAMGEPIAWSGGLLDEQKLIDQMRYPERF